MRHGPCDRVDWAFMTSPGTTSPPSGSYPSGLSSGPSTDATYRFGEFLLDPRSARLEREITDGEEAGTADREVIEIADLQLRLLECLVRRAGEIVTRTELQEALWGRDTFLEADNSLNSAMSRLRDALGDSAGEPRFIETVPRRGYRFVAPVEVAEKEGQAPARPTDAETFRPPLWFKVLASAAALLAVLFLFRPRPEPPRPGDISAASGSRFDEPADRSTTLAESPLDPDDVRTTVQRARELAARGTHGDLERAIATYLEALTRQPDAASGSAPGSAPVYAGLAMAYIRLAEADYWRPRDAYVPARALAQRALELDPGDADALLATAWLSAVADWHVEAALEQVERALAADPSSVDAGLFRAQLLSALGRHDEALAQAREVIARDPAAPELNARYSWLLFRARRFDEAIEQAEKTIALAPRHAEAYDRLKWIHLHQGHEAETARVWEMLVELEGGDGAAFRQRLAEQGIENMLRSNVEKRLQRAAEPGYLSPYDIVLDLVQIGELDDALRWLERSVAERETDVPSLHVDPRIDALRDDPRFVELVAGVGIDSAPFSGAKRRGR